MNYSEIYQISFHSGPWGKPRTSEMCIIIPSYDAKIPSSMFVNYVRNSNQMFVYKVMPDMQSS